MCFVDLKQGDQWDVVVDAAVVVDEVGAVDNVMLMVIFASSVSVQIACSYSWVVSFESLSSQNSKQDYLFLA